MSTPPIPGAPAGQEQRRARIILLVVNLVLVLLAVTVLIWPHWVSGIVRDISPGCIFRKFTGLSCPGCGGTRAARAMLAGDWLAALQYNLLLPLGMLLLLAEYARLWVMSFVKRPPAVLYRGYLRLVLISAWLVLIWFVVRNLLGI